MYNVRLMTKEDYPMIASWWHRHNMGGCPPYDVYPEESSFILTKNDVPVLNTVLLLLNTKRMCWQEGLISDPDFQENRAEAVVFLQKHVDQFAKEKGYKTIFTLSYPNGVAKICETRLGFKRTAEGLISFSKEL